MWISHFYSWVISTDNVSMRLISPITTLCIRVEDICSPCWLMPLSEQRRRYPSKISEKFTKLIRTGTPWQRGRLKNKIQNNCSELADALTAAGLNRKVSRNTNSSELLSHKSCSPVSALKDSNNVLICELKPNTLGFLQENRFVSSVTNIGFKTR